MTALAEVVLSADTLPLPEGVSLALRVDGMREVVSYHIAYDGFVARWDTIIDGKQYSVGKVVPHAVIGGPWFNAMQWVMDQRTNSRAQLIRAFHDGKPSIAGTPVYFIQVHEQEPGRVA